MLGTAAVTAKCDRALCLLTLANNERIAVTPSMRLLFELSSLAYATPATVSRGGVLYLTASSQWRHYYSSWVHRHDAAPSVLEVALRVLHTRLAPPVRVSGHVVAQRLAGKVQGVAQKKYSILF